jgi:nitrite reductase/ring-hydroxylating ferredoxin subunit
MTQQEMAVPDLERLVAHLERRWTDQVPEQLVISPAIYTDPEMARLERERVFGRVPVIAAHGTELPQPGSFITTRLPNNEAIVVRQEDGSVRGFVNACRHRGSMVEDRPSGLCPARLQCPYHGWSYNLDGSLKSATHEVSFGEFNHIEAGLIRLPVEERHGFVWIVDNAEATIDVAAWLGPEMDAILGSYGMEKYVCFTSGSFHEPSNWKILQDAFLDGYHIQFVHRETAAKMTYTNILTLEDYGRHTRFMSPRKKLGRLLEERAENGNGDSERGLSDEEILKVINISHGLLPNATLLYLPDHIQLLSFYPDPKDPGQSRMEIRLIVPSLEASGWDEEKWNSIWNRNWEINMDILRDEDFPIAHRTQRAVESVNAGPLIVGRNEVANSVFHRELRNLLEADA